MFFDSLTLPRAVLRPEDVPAAMLSAALAREKIALLEAQAAIFALAQVFLDNPELSYFRFYKIIPEAYGKERESTRLVSNLWNADDPAFPDSLLNPDPDMVMSVEDQEADEELDRALAAQSYRDLELWVERLSAEAFFELSSKAFRAPHRPGEDALVESLMRVALSEAAYARWEALRLELDSRHAAPLTSHAPAAPGEIGRAKSL